MPKVDKYGRGSAAANGEGFVDLAPGDTFAALEAQLKQRIADRFDNAVLGISARIGSKRNASELAKHLASGEEEEVHKFAAKNVGVLFARGRLGISHDDKKAVAGQRWITRFIRVFTPFGFAGDGYLATLTLKDVDPDKRICAVEAVEINQDAKSRSTPRGAISEDLNSAPFQDLTSQLAEIIAYYVGDVNRTRPSFVGRMDTFSTERTVELLEGIMQDFRASHQAPSIRHQAPRFSIIIPVYNVAPYLHECLDSVLAQTIADWEAICIDDGSTDESGAILDEYAAKDGRFKVFHQENRGVSATRQRGLELARGEYVGWVDSDDIIEPSHFENLYRAIEGSQADLVWCGYVEERDGVRSVCMMLCEESAQAMLEGVLTCRIMGFLFSKLFRRAKIVESSAQFPQYCQIMEDTYFLAGFLRAHPTVKYVAQTTYHYLVRSNSLSNQGGSRSWWEMVILADEDICRLVSGRVGREVLVRRAGVYKNMLFGNVQIPDLMFYAYHPEIRRLPNGIAAWGRRLQFCVATFHCRWIFRFWWMVKRGVKSLLRS